MAQIMFGKTTQIIEEHENFILSFSFIINSAASCY